MRAIRTNLRRLRSDKRGATAIEYGLIVACIAIAMIAGLQTLGGGTDGMWGKLEDRVVTSMRNAR